MIWPQPINIEALNSRKENLATLIGIQFTTWDENSLTATMPVDDRTKQPAGILHGGASVALAETLGSVASFLLIDSINFLPVGLEINANHLRPVSSGIVKGVCTPIHIGKKTHVWDIKIYNEEGKMNCISRLTVAIVPRK